LNLFEVVAMAGVFTPDVPPHSLIFVTLADLIRPKLTLDYIRTYVSIKTSE